MGGVQTLVVGGGIVGLAVARELAGLEPDGKVTVLEKEAVIGSHQSGRNSGVVHSGFYYEQGTLKAELCQRGRVLLRDFCESRDIAYIECGKVVVAVDERERGLLERLHDRAKHNEVAGVRILGPEELRELEPHARGIAALHSPTAAIVDYPGVCRALADDLVVRGGEVVCDAEVTGIEHVGRRVRVKASDGTREVDRVIVCAGLHADRLARMAGDEVEPMTVPFRGEYFRLRPERAELVRGLIYPVPDPRYPFLGVHLSRRTDGSVDIGPNAVLALAREGDRWAAVSGSDMAELLRYRGFWAFARTHWKTGAKELAGSLSKRTFTRRARRYVPELRSADLVRAPGGVRAQALNRDGSLVDDFVISARGRVTLVRNAPSPGATSSLAIAEHICAQVVDRAGMT